MLIKHPGNYTIIGRLQPSRTDILKTGGIVHRMDN
jgi:hypothetical protein